MGSDTTWCKWQGTNKVFWERSTTRTPSQGLKAQTRLKTPHLHLNHQNFLMHETYYQHGSMELDTKDVILTSLWLCWLDLETSKQGKDIVPSMTPWIPSSPRNETLACNLHLLNGRKNKTTKINCYFWYANRSQNVEVLRARKLS